MTTANLFTSLFIHLLNIVSSNSFTCRLRKDPLRVLCVSGTLLSVSLVLPSGKLWFYSPNAFTRANRRVLLEYAPRANNGVLDA